MPGTRHWRCIGAAILALSPAASWASYGQMWIDVRPLMVVAGIVGGVAVGLFDLAFWRGQAIRRLWFAAGLALTGLLGAAAILASPALRSAALIPLLAGSALLVWAVEQLFWHLRLGRVVRCVLIGLAGLLLIGLLDPGNPREVGAGWFFGPLLLVWAVATLFAGDRAPAAPAPPRIYTLDELQPSAAWATLGSAFAGLLAFVRAVPGALWTGLASAGLVLRGVLVCVAIFVLGALLVGTGIGILSTPLLAFAGALPGAPEAPIGDPSAALAYWLSHGILPSALLTLAGLPWWRRIVRN